MSETPSGPFVPNNRSTNNLVFSEELGLLVPESARPAPNSQQPTPTQPEPTSFVSQRTPLPELGKIGLQVNKSFAKDPLDRDQAKTELDAYEKDEESRKRTEAIKVLGKKENRSIFAPRIVASVEDLFPARAPKKPSDPSDVVSTATRAVMSGQLPPSEKAPTTWTERHNWFGASDLRTKEMERTIQRDMLNSNYGTSDSLGLPLIDRATRPVTTWEYETDANGNLVWDSKKNAFKIKVVRKRAEWDYVYKYEKDGNGRPVINPATGLPVIETSLDPVTNQNVPFEIDPETKAPKIERVNNIDGDQFQFVYDQWGNHIYNRYRYDQDGNLERDYRGEPIPILESGPMARRFERHSSMLLARDGGLVSSKVLKLDSEEHAEYMKEKGLPFSEKRQRAVQRAIRKIRRLAPENSEGLRKLRQTSGAEDPPMY